MKHIQTYEADKALRLSRDVYHIIITVVGVKESDGRTSFNFHLVTSLRESYEDIWYSKGPSGKPNLFRVDRKETGIKGFLEGCVIRNLMGLKVPAPELVSEYKPETVYIQIPYVPDISGRVALPEASNGQLKFPFTDGHVVLFARRRERRRPA